MEFAAVFTPLLSFILIGLLGRRIPPAAAQAISCIGMLIAVSSSLMLFYNVNILHQPYTSLIGQWFVSGDFSVEWSLRVDQLSVVMMCVINLVSTCVHVYSIGYMSHDEARARFMAYLSLFSFAMLILVVSDNLIQLFFGWESVGLASYLLIGFWNEKHSANAAAQKAFVVNRVGDFGLALGIMACFAVFGTVEFDAIFAQVADKAQVNFEFFGYQIHAMTLIGLLLFTGAVGKSAQLGLHTWLPDAMEGPTPVSALIHAATMVTAGVFLIVRFSPLYEYAPTALITISVFGGLTAFVAATTGMTQFDIKRVIAYSTMSQLGYMFFAVGVSAYGAAMFHLVTHAFFKSLMFLSAGSVIHAMSGEQDMRKMGGLWKLIPVTYGLMWIGVLALCGIPPFSGFFSKDIVIEAVWMADTAWADTAFWLIILAAFQTSLYSSRLIFMTFHGKSRADHETLHHVHESPPVMLIPLGILALGAIFSGMFLYDSFVGSSHGEPSNSILHVFFKDMAEHWSKETFWQKSIFILPENDTVEMAHSVPLWVKRLPLLAGVLGIMTTFFLYVLRPGLPEKIKNAFPPLYRLFHNKWYFDEIYDAVFVRSSFRIGRLLSRADRAVIDRFGPDGAARSSGMFAGVLSRFQNGYVYHYAFVMIIALVGLMSWFVYRAAGVF